MCIVSSKFSWDYEFKKDVMRSVLNGIGILLCGIGFAQDIKRDVVYSLGKDEIVIEGEAKMMYATNKRNFAMVTLDTLTYTQRFVWNGKVVFESDYIDVKYLNLNEENGYTIKYYENEQVFINFRGKICGPYENAEVLFEIGGGEPALAYKLGTKWYMTIGLKKYGPFVSMPSNLEIQEKGSGSTIESHYYAIWAYDERYCKQNLTTVISGDNILEAESSNLYLNGTLKNSYDEKRSSIIAISFISPKRFGFVAYHDEETEVWINGKSTLLKGSQLGFTLTASDYFIAIGYPNGSNAILKNGQLYLENFDELIAYNANGDVMYKQDDAVFVNKKRVGDCQGYVRSGVIKGEKIFAYAFYHDEENKIVDISGVKATHSYIWDLNIDVKGAISYRYVDNANAYRKSKTGAIANDSPDFSRVYGSIEIKLDNGRHFFESNYEYDYVVIDGEMYGHSPAIQAWHDKVSNSLQWTCLENNQYVQYTKVLR